MLKDAVPYDFGGIAVIDKLTVAPPKKEESKKSKEEEEKPESATQSTIPGPEEPSLRNVVTAAEDFIKVLATVSTSQSSNNDSDKGETQSSEKKRKNKEKKKKTSKKRKGKGKGRKRKQKAEEGGAAASPSGGKAEEVIALSNFISESDKHEQSNTKRVGDSEYKLGGNEEPFNEVMRDEPAMEKEAVSVTSSMKVQKKPAGEISVSTPTSTTTEANTRRQRKGRKKSKKIPLPSSEELVTNTTDNISVPTIITIAPSFVVSTASTPFVIPKVKRNRSKERGDREGRKKRRKLSSASPIVDAAHENSSTDDLKVIPLTGAPTVPTTERQVSHRMEVYGRRTTALNSSFSVLKKQKSKGFRSRRRKTVLPLFSSETPPILQTPKTTAALESPATTAAISRPTEETETHEWRLFTTITAAPSVITKRHRQTIRQQRKPRKKAMLLLSVPIQTEQTPLTFTTTPPGVVTTEELNLQRSEKPSVTTSAAPVMSPIQLSIERVRAQFSRKKRRKAALAVRHQ